MNIITLLIPKLLYKIVGVEDVELKEILKRSGLIDLYDKFCKAKVTAQIIWKLDDKDLKDEVKLNGIEKKRYKEAQKENINKG